MRILAIDYGKARIGLAYTDLQKILALPFQTVRAGKTMKITIQNILNALKDHLKEIEKIVIGLPLYLNGTLSPMAQEVKIFAKELEKKISIPIVFLDERLTTAFADRSLKDLQINRKKRAKIIDQAAATIILQNYLLCSK